ncbi:aspartate kinase [Aphanothece sacrum]|uniref:Aspartate kinase n=1 Tax=Aphanothece sacrum FPU1 TaxID=1920663 RepID=A0A401IGW1_APHSA|nr:aspartate kinase [Aphanothece sacrum]GBF80527.1 aspartate kinase [Aphanothece sacrum FPU1]GBF85918.1 aspartate kinase [Aphanothece sacrum FPU3]
MTTSLLSRPSVEQGSNTASSSVQATLGTNYQTQMIQVKKSYQAVQQLKYLHLQAEIDVLLQQLQTIKQKANKS